MDDPHTQSSPESTHRKRRMRWIFTGDNGMRAGWGVVVFIAMGVAIILAISRLWHIFFGHLLHRETLVTLPAFYLGESIQIAGLLGALAVVATIERRPMLSFGWHDSAGWARFGGGLLCGFVALSLCVLILLRMHLLALDAPSAHGTTLWTHAVAWGGLFLLVAIFEESALRGYLQYTLTRGIGFWWSALLLSILFAGIHGSNPGETPVGLITAGAIGMLLCLSLWYTGSLFWAIGFHTAWDWGQSYFYGTSDSGVLLDNRLFSAHPFGNVLLSGGQTGPEGSLLVLPMILVMALLMWLWWGRKTPSPFRGSGWKPASGMTRRNLFSTDTQ